MKTGTSGLLTKFLFRQRVNAVKRLFCIGTVLEIGCGGSPLISRINREVKYCGVDIEEEAISNIRKKYPGIEFVVWDAEKDKSSFKERKFDNVVMLAVVEHLSNPKKALKKICRLLNKNGSLIITTPTKMANTILHFGSKMRLFDRSAEEDHQSILNKMDFMIFAKILKMKMSYSRFCLGLNQLVVYSKENKRG